MQRLTISVLIVGVLGFTTLGCNTGSRSKDGNLTTDNQGTPGQKNFPNNPNGTDTDPNNNSGLITGIAPATGSPLGGTLVTITGQDYDATTQVCFGDEPGTDVTVNSPTELTVVTPPGEGLVDVEVKNGDGERGRLNNAFFYDPNAGDDDNQPFARVADHGDPSAEDQEMVELINKARRNPTAEGQRLGLDFSSYPAKPPLSPNEFLASAATKHCQDMADRSFYDHVNPDGIGPNERVRRDTYDLNDEYGTGLADNFTESIGVATGNELNTPQKVVDAFLRDEGVNPPKHRDAIFGKGNLMGKAREIGVGFLTDTPNAQFDHYVALEKARTNRDRPILSGVVYDDDGDDMYRAGEGTSSVKVVVSDDKGNSVETFTKGAGGYAFEFFKDGTYTLDVGGQQTQVTIAGENVKVDSVSGQLVAH